MPDNVLCVDPGFERLGVAVLARPDKLLFSECIRTSAKETKANRLLVIGKRLEEIIEEYRPGSLAIETLFFNRNTSSAIGVAEARGVVLYKAAASGLHVYEYSPQAVKIAVTGYGKADKIQVSDMVKKLVKLPLTKTKRLDDELDAIALGITCLATEKGI